MSAIRFGTAIYAREIPPYVEWCRVAEDSGFDWLGYGDSATLWMDPFVILGVAAANTRRVRLGTTVTNPVTRHPAVMASGFAALQHLSGGRMFCGIGGGDSGIYNSQLKPAKMAEIGEYASAVRDLCAGREASYHGAKIKMQWNPLPVPIWVSAEGPKTLEFAGRVADGVIVGTGLTENVVKDSIARIDAGARAAGRDPSKIEKWWLTKIHFAPTREQGWKELQFTLAASANHALRFTTQGKFVPPGLDAAIRALQSEYAQHEHADFRKPGYNASLVEKHGLTEFLGQRYSLCGPAESIVQDLKRMASWGVNGVMITQLFQDQIGFMRRLSKEIFPAFL
jgi:5,10-methylenetetrahydromethanopterin reductase